MTEIDRCLAQKIVERGVPLFGENMKNKSDSPSCMFDVRKLFTQEVFTYVRQRLGEVITRDCSGSGVCGLVTSGVPWATIACEETGLPLSYVRKKKEPNVSNKYVDGVVPEDRKLILIDDLLFAGESKNDAMEILQKEGFLVTDIVVIVDRQIQRVKDGPPIDQKWGVKLHRLITMSEVINYMIETGNITEEQLGRLIRDYRHFERWEMPDFAKVR